MPEPEVEILDLLRELADDLVLPLDGGELHVALDRTRSEPPVHRGDLLAQQGFETAPGLKLPVQGGQSPVHVPEPLLKLFDRPLQEGDLLLQAAELREVRQGRLDIGGAREPPAGGKLGGLDQRGVKLGDEARVLPNPHAGPLAALGADHGLGAKARRVPKLLGGEGALDPIVLEKPIPHL